MRHSNNHSHFVDIMGLILRIFVLGIFILILGSMVLGFMVTPSLTVGLLALIFPFVLRVGLTLICFMAIAITLEALGST